MRHKLPIALLCAGILSALLCLSGCGAKEPPKSTQAPKPVHAAPQQTEPAQTEPTVETTPIEEITHLDIQVEASGLWDLLDYPNLKSVDLRLG